MIWQWHLVCKKVCQNEVSFNFEFCFIININYRSTVGIQHGWKHKRYIHDFGAFVRRARFRGNCVRYVAVGTVVSTIYMYILLIYVYSIRIKPTYLFLFENCIWLHMLSWLRLLILDRFRFFKRNSEINKVKLLIPLFRKLKTRG